MDAPPFYHPAEGHAVLRLAGPLELSQVVGLITHAITFARASAMPRLLVVLTEVTALRVPGLAARYEFIREWARQSGGMVRLALVLSAEMMDPRKFGVTVAANAGMTANVFTDENEALAWLLREG